jgi:transposase
MLPGCASGKRSWGRWRKLPPSRSGPGKKGGGPQEQNGQGAGNDPGREERRRVRRRRRLRLHEALLGRSRGGLTSKIHLAGDRRCRPLSLVLTAGQSADSPQFVTVLEKVRVRMPVGRTCTRPGAVAGDKAYSSRGNRAYLRRRGITAVIPEKRDQAANQERKGGRGGRPVGHDADLYEQRNTVERLINKLKAWRGIATRYDKTPESYLAGLRLRASMIWINDLLQEPD